jgi:hypothetical protein
LSTSDSWLTTLPISLPRAAKNDESCHPQLTKTELEE